MDQRAVSLVGLSFARFTRSTKSLHAANSLVRSARHGRRAASASRRWSRGCNSRGCTAHAIFTAAAAGGYACRDRTPSEQPLQCQLAVWPFVRHGLDCAATQLTCW